MKPPATTPQPHMELHQLADELATANRELENFSYAVSHDLRAPLRAVDGYSRILAEDYSRQLDEEGQRLLGVIRAETCRMGHLIDGLLAFSRLGREEINPEPLDMAELAREVFEELASRETPDRNLQLTLHPLPHAHGSRRMIREAWQHLIGNAIKFTRGRDHATIEIGSLSRDPGPDEYFVRDNGAGFDATQAARLFGVFQRFHTDEEFPGIGIGLALAQRILHRHGGTIRAESQPGIGTTLFFTVPSQPPP